MARKPLGRLIVSLIAAPLLALAAPALPSAGAGPGAGAARWVAQQREVRCFPGFVSARMAGAKAVLPVNPLPFRHEYEIGQGLATRFARLAPPHAGRGDLFTGSWDPARRLGAVARLGDEYAEIVVLRAAAPPPVALRHRLVPLGLGAGLGIGSTRAAVERYFGRPHRAVRSARACSLTAEAFATTDVPLFAYRFVYRNDRVVAFSYFFEA